MTITAIEAMTNGRGAMPSDLPHSIEEHRADELVRDERVQRGIIAAHTRGIVNALKLDGIGVITASRREDGSLVILDGQHRIQALIDAGLGAHIVTCEVYEGLTLAQEAAVFRLRNNTRKPTALDDYLKGVVAGDPECLAIETMVHRHDLRVALVTEDGVVSCVAAMRKVYRASKGGPAALGFALSVATHAWGTKSEATEGHIIGGLGMVYLRYGEKIDRPALIRKLAKYNGGALGLIGKAKGFRDIRRMTVARAVAVLVIDLYNSGRRERLPEL